MKGAEPNPEHLPKNSKNFKTIRNILVYQQGVYLSLLTKHLPITFKKPFKKANVFGQLLCIESIGEADGKIEVHSFIEDRCKSRYLFELQNGVIPKTAKRRLESNRMTEVMLLLCDMLREFGYFFEIRDKRGKKDTLKADNVVGIWYQGKKIITEEQIEKKGSEFNASVLEFLKNKEKITLVSDVFGDIHQTTDS